MNADITEVGQLPTERLSPTEDVDHEMETLWFRLEVDHHFPIALVALPNVTPDAVIEVCRRLGAVGANATSEPVVLVDATSIGVGQSERVMAQLRGLAEESPYCIVALSSPVSAPASLPIIRAFRKVLLVAQVGVTRAGLLEDVQRAVGERRVLGCLCLKRPSRRMLRRARRDGARTA